jgi:hypothetical protein
VGTVAVIGLVTVLVAVWAANVLFDPEEVSAAVGAALDEPEVTDALARYLTDQVLVAVGAEDAIVELLPGELERLAPAIVGGVRAHVVERLAGALAEPEVRAVIVAVTERSHRALMRVLQGDGLLDGVTVADGEVTVNLLPLVGRGLAAVQELGLLQQVELPVLRPDGDPDAQRAELATALGRDLPDQFGELVVYRGEAVEQAEASVQAAQRLVVLAKRALVALVVVTLVAAGASVALARRRWRAALTLALASVVAMVLVRALGAAVIERAPTIAVQPGARAAIGRIVGSLVDGLITTATLVAVVGAVVALAVWLGDADGVARRRLGSTWRTLVTQPEPLGVAALAGAVVVLLVAGFGLVQLAIVAVLVGAGTWAMRAAPVGVGDLRSSPDEPEA